jgi:hypothetical protein
VTTDEQERVALLCQQIAVEQDRKKFTDLVDELNQLLEAKDHRLGDPGTLS